MVLKAWFTVVKANPVSFLAVPVVSIGSFWQCLPTSLDHDGDSLKITYAPLLHDSTNRRTGFCTAISLRFCFEVSLLATPFIVRRGCNIPWCS